MISNPDSNPFQQEESWIDFKEIKIWKGKKAKTFLKAKRWRQEDMLTPPQRPYFYDSELAQRAPWKLERNQLVIEEISRWLDFSSSKMENDASQNNQPWFTPVRKESEQTDMTMEVLQHAHHQQQDL